MEHTGYFDALSILSIIDDLVVDIGEVLKLTKRVVGTVWRLTSGISYREDDANYKNVMKSNEVEELMSG